MNSSEAELSGAVPLCKGCNHHHHQGTKCSVCGHVGQSHLYARMCDKAKAHRRYRVQCQPLDEKEECEHMRAISLELRRQVFCLESEAPIQEDLDEFEEGSRCLVGYVGDLPIWTARWRLLPACSSAVVDRMAVLSDFRGQGVTSSSVDHIFTDIRNVTERNGAPVSFVIALVPENSWMESKLAEKGFDVTDKTVQCVRGGVSYCNGVLTL
mmetsp:Transcript_26006/g.48850  ORF Transcript_26006/g.48850 Transcript_26006/m.48850 type:complete len:211 (+) Transcript_26006:111-743(+)